MSLLSDLTKLFQAKKKRIGDPSTGSQIQQFTVFCAHERNNGKINKKQYNTVINTINQKNN